MGPIDWTILCLYLAGMIALSARLARGQKNAADYYVGGRNLPWWAVGVSTMATQTSATSFVSIPAFVALTEGGGLSWLQYELAVPLAMIFVMIVLIPFFRRLELISVYEYLELRFGPGTRKLMSAIFLVSRSLATGVILYVSGLVLSVCLGLPVWICIIIIAIVTIIYDTLGGMAAVVYSDVIQMVVLLGGVALCVAFALLEVGGFGAAVGMIPSERLSGINPGHGFGDGADMPFWGFLIGGVFLYTAYYGVDQSQTQRELSAPTTDDTKKALVFNGLARFPLTMCYMVLGIAVGAVFLASADLQEAVPDDELDQLIPQFILAYLPVGLTGILFAAIFSAAMSSFDSALNSLSASTLRDFVEPLRGGGSGDGWLLRAGKVVTVLWGVVITGFALLVGNLADTVIEAINLIGSVFYGPVLAAFLAGILDPRARGAGVTAGVVVGVGLNLVFAADSVTGALGLLGEHDVHWMWWNLTGVVVAGVVTAVVSRFQERPSRETLERTTLRLSTIRDSERPWLGTYVLLVLYFVAILVVASQSEAILAAFAD